MRGLKIKGSILPPRNMSPSASTSIIFIPTQHIKPNSQFIPPSDFTTAMQLTNILAAIAMLAMSAAPVLAAPEAIPERDTRAQCIGGHNLIGSGCAPRLRDKTSCAANDRAVVSNPQSSPRAPGTLVVDVYLLAFAQIICTGPGPTWHLQNACQRGSCNNNCVCT